MLKGIAAPHHRADLFYFTPSPHSGDKGVHESSRYFLFIGKSNPARSPKRSKETVLVILFSLAIMYFC